MGWTVRYLADGLVLTPPDSPGFGNIRLRERQPLCTAVDVIEKTRVQMSGFDSLNVSPLERFTTYEGEYAALCTVVGQRGTRRFERSIGMVWGDFHYSRIDGGTDEPTRFGRFRQAVRDLTYFHALGLGELRRRRFVYTPPTGWQGYARGLVAHWYAPGFPNDDRMIRVFPAYAGSDNAARELDRQLHEMSWFGFRQETADEPIALSSQDGLSGHLWRLVGRFGGRSPRFLQLAILQDNRFYYTLRWESQRDEEAQRQLFAEMARSVESLPRPVSSMDAETFAHWAT